LYGCRIGDVEIWHFAMHAVFGSFLRIFPEKCIFGIRWFLLWQKATKDYDDEACGFLP